MQVAPARGAAQRAAAGTGARPAAAAAAARWRPLPLLPLRARGAELRRRRGIATRDTVLGATEASSAEAAAAEASPAVAAAAAKFEAGVDAAAGAAGAEAAAGGAPAAGSAVGKSHPLALTEDLFAAEELVQELSDTASLGKRGEVWLMAQALAVLFVIWPPFKLAGLFDLIATLALTAGLVFCLYGLICLGRNFSPLPAPRKTHKLVTTGLYAHLRHPIYGGLVLAALGLAAVTRSEGRLALAIALWAIVERKAAFEEAALVQRYGDAYASYRARTKKFIPFLY